MVKRLSLLFLFILVSCNPLGEGQKGSYKGENYSPGLDEAAPDHLEIVQGNGQGALYGTTLLTPLQVKVVDSRGVPISEVNLSVTILTGSGSASASRITTNGSGIARVNWTLGPTPGANTLKIAGETLFTGSPKEVTFTATALNGTPSAATSTITGSGPVIADGLATSTVTITVLDAASNPIEGFVPTFSASGSGNSYGTCSSSNVAGVSTCTLASTVAESKTLSLVTPVSVTGGAVSFVSGAAFKVAFSTNPSTTATAGSLMSQQPVMRILDANNNVVNSNATIEVTLHSDASCATAAVTTTPDGSASLTGTTSLAAVNGTATFTNLIINKALSTLYLKAYSGVLNEACSPVINVSPGAFSLADSTLGVSSATVISGSAITVTLTGKDSFGNANPSGMTGVTFGRTVVGGTGSFGGATNAGGGVYTASFTGAISGAVTLSGLINAIAITQTQNITVIAGAASTIAVSSGNSQSAAWN